MFKKLLFVREIITFQELLNSQIEPKFYDWALNLIGDRIDNYDRFKDDLEDIVKMEIKKYISEDYAIAQILNFMEGEFTFYHKNNKFAIYELISPKESFLN
jgi:hypothetical protein